MRKAHLRFFLIAVLFSLEVVTSALGEQYSVFQSQAAIRKAHTGELPALVQDFSNQSGAFSGNAHESIDLASGHLQLFFTDIDIPGPHGFDIKVQRVFRGAQNEAQSSHDLYGAGWSFVVPHVTVLPQQADYFCQHTANKMCPPMLTLPDGETEYIVNGMTKDNWRVDGGFNVKSPNGNVYSFGTRTSDLRTYLLDQIKDTYGDTIEYHWQGAGLGIMPELKSITASDGREVDFSYTGGSWPTLETMTANGKTWRYHYSYNGSKGTYLLDSVKLPDGRQWSYGYGLLLNNAKDVFLTNLVQVDSPSGSRVKYSYWGVSDPFPFSRLTGKTVFDNKGNKTGSWSFSYKGSYTGDMVTTVIGPKTRTVYTHEIYNPPYLAGQIVLDNSEGYPFWRDHLLLDKEVYDRASGEKLEADHYKWINRPLSDGAGNPEVCSPDYNDLRLATLFCGTVGMPVLSQRTINRDGVTYQANYSDFDAMGHATTVVEVGDQGLKRTVHLLYENSVNPWRSDFLKQEVVESVGVVLNRVYNKQGSVLEEDHYGVPIKYTYDSHGNLSTTTDANNFVTTYSNYFRSIAQTIQYSDRTIETKKVNPTGTVASVTDQRGYTTGYTYDGLNRLKSITPPRGAPTTLSYDDAKSGLGGHTLTRGNYQEIVKTDGLGHVTQVRKTDLAKAQTIVQDMKYDALGQLVFKSFPYYDSDDGGAENGVYRTYDALSRPKTIEYPTQAANSSQYIYIPVWPQNKCG